MSERIPKIPKEQFAFVQQSGAIRDKKLETKPVGYFKDALIRFRRNKASVVAALIILILVIYAIIAPILSPFTVSFRDGYLRHVLPKNPLLKDAGFWDGCQVEQLNDNNYNYYYAMGVETGNQPIHSVVSEYETETRLGTKVTKTHYRDARVDSYYKVGVIFVNLTKGEYQKLVKWQTATGIQVLYPAVDVKKFATGTAKTFTEDASIWYKCNAKGQAILDENGDFTPIYMTDDTLAYQGTRIPSDPGNYAYVKKTQTGYTVRASYYEYYQYIYSGSVISDTEDTSNDTYLVYDEPCFLFGTNQYGQDIFVCLASGARFSFLLAICVSIVNLTIGAIYGAIEGYYGGAVDMTMERISDILSGVPFIIVATLFQLHLASSVGVVGSLLFAFVLTGWIGMASTVRMQFYRFKGQEYVLAARTLGAKDSRLIMKHIFPNAIGTIITGCVLVIPGVIFTESSLSYLKIVNLSTSSMTSVGTMLADGQAYLQSFPHIILFPSLFISLLMITFNLFGNGLRDAFNPSLRGADD